MRKLAKELLKKYNPDFIADAHDVIGPKFFTCSLKEEVLRFIRLIKEKRIKKSLPMYGI